MIKIVLLVVVIPVVLVVVFAIRRKIKCPEKDFMNAVIEVSLTPLRMMKLGPFAAGTFDLDRSLKRAVKKTKLTDFGGTDFITNYRLMMSNPHYTQQKFTNIGYIAAGIEINMTWARRLKLIDYIKKNPAVLNVPVPSPCFVMGLPRTGTTFLHRLLSMDPAIRAPLLWELLNPVPTVPPTATASEKDIDRKKRTEVIRKLIDKRKQMGDHALSHIHEIEHNLPEECLMALTDELPINLQFLYSCYMAAKEFLTLDARNTYVYYRKFLQLLSYQLGETESPRRWMLKCPIHLFYTKELAAAFPDAKLIW
jgi:hypothetical protein